MNTLCGATTSPLWKKGWELKSGQAADLCIRCGSAYEKAAYCDTFHSEETGWRECSLCNKRLHCGCCASVSFLDIQDFGGVWCINCARNAGCHSVQRDGTHHEAKASGSQTITDIQKAHKLDNDALNGGSLLTLGGYMEANEPRYLPQSHTDQKKESFVQMKPDVNASMALGTMGFPNLPKPPFGSSMIAKQTDKPKLTISDMHELRLPSSLNISLHVPTEPPNLALTLPGGTEEGDKNRSALFQSGPKPRHILPKPPKTNPPKGPETNKGSGANMRVARPPAEGRLRNQLLPRYWPRITDQELQQLSGDLNSTIVPLFEKVLSASDASRIGRLVLPKACAEAYFPTINQSEGLPLKIQDVKGNEWTFQFRFWPNNNSRMYVLEGVTPCIQSMQLQAGDTVTFSRIDPGGKLVMGFRKASSNATEPQEPQASAPPNSAASGEGFYSDGTDSPTMNGYSGLLQPTKGSKDDHPSSLPEQSVFVNGEIILGKNEKMKARLNENSLQQSVLGSEKKRTRNVGPKNKRLLMHREDALELKITWEETQDLLRPPPAVQANIVVIEDCEIEEFTEPPVFGKRTVFTSLPSGGYEQWAQCDKCMKWRKLPVDVLLPPKWTCSDNIWDASRSSCSAHDEMDLKELDNLLKTNRDTKRRRIEESSDAGRGPEPSGLDALATAATLGDDSRGMEEPSGAATTRHPRHRPGCTCIVCIQPPSGKGKHKPNCICTVCCTVKRRFKTLMMRKRQRQSEHEAEVAQQSNNCPGKESQVNDAPNDVASHKDTVMENETSQENNLADEGEGGGNKGGHIDLNCHPNREEDMHPETSSFAQAASHRSEMFTKQQTDSGSSKNQPQQASGTCDGHGSPPEEEHSISAVGEQESRDADGPKPPSE